MLKNYMKRDKFFWVNPTLFNDREWPYKSRYAIGVRLADFRARNEPIFRFKVEGRIYEIERTKAFKYGLKYMINQGVLPNLLPLEEFSAHPVQRQGQPSAKATESLKTDGQQSRNLQFNF